MRTIIENVLEGGVGVVDDSRWWVEVNLSATHKNCEACVRTQKRESCTSDENDL